MADDAPLVLFDFSGLSDRLAPALTLAVADYVEWRVHQLRRRRVSGELDGHGRWAGRAQLIIEEGWKPLSSPAAGAWLNEYARRARHYALWLTFITQFVRDFDSEQGRAMLSNHAIALCLPNERRDLEHARDALGLTDTDITGRRTSQSRLASTERWTGPTDTLARRRGFADESRTSASQNHSMPTAAQATGQSCSAGKRSSRSPSSQRLLPPISAVHPR